MEVNDKEINKKEEFDYLWILIKNWKKLLLSGVILFFIGGITFFFVGKSISSTSSFLIRLPKEINTPYGTYELMTYNPSFYIEQLESSQFRQKVCDYFNIKDVSSINLIITTEGTRQIIEDKVIYPEKYELTVEADDDLMVDSINDKALILFKQNMDQLFFRNVKRGVYNDLSKSIKSLSYTIQSKRALIDSISTIKVSEVLMRGNKVRNLDDQIYALNEKDNSAKELLLAMMINNGKNGPNYYKNAVLVLEQNQLTKSKNLLAKDQLLLKDVSQLKWNAEVDAQLNRLFSDSFLLLSPSKIDTISRIGLLLKALLFAVVGTAMVSLIILIREYYSDKLNA